jgi:hypothetical protein
MFTTPRTRAHDTRKKMKRTATIAEIDTVNHYVYACAFAFDKIRSEFHDEGMDAKPLAEVWDADAKRVRLSLLTRCIRGSGEAGKPAIVSRCFRHIAENMPQYAFSRLLQTEKERKEFGNVTWEDIASCVDITACDKAYANAFDDLGAFDDLDDFDGAVDLDYNHYGDEDNEDVEDGEIVE